MRFRKMSAPRVGMIIALGAPTVLSAQHQVEEVLVVGTPHDQSPAEMAQSISVLAGDRLWRHRVGTIGETLAGELGVSSTYFGSGASRPVIRGLAGARVKIMEDGIDALDLSGISADHAVGVDPIAAQQIEVFRGPTTLLYGSGAVGGVVNTVTNRLPMSAPEGGLDTVIELGAETAARARSGAFAMDGGSDRIAWHVDAARRRAEDYSIPPGAAVAHSGEADAGVLKNSGFDVSSGAIGVSWLGERSSVGVSVSTFASDYGVPGHAHDALPHGHDDHGGAAHERLDETHSDDVRVDLDSTRVDLRAEWFGLPRFPEIALRVGYNDYEHFELESGEIASHFRNDAYEARIEVLHSPWGEWNGAFGASFGGRALSAIGAEAFLPPVDTRSFGAFVLEHRDVGPWRLSLGARLEQVRHEPVEGAAVSASARSLSAAAIRSLPAGVSLVVNAAFAERAPAAEELFLDGPHLASGAYEMGDRALGVEASRHLDVGIRRADGRITWAVTGFRTEYDDFIYLAATGLEHAGTGLPLHRQVQRDARLSGFEAELFAQVVEIGRGEIDLRLFGDYVRATLANGERVPRIPPRRSGLRLQYHDDRVVAGVEAVRHDAQRRIAAFETPTDGYTQLAFDVALKLRQEADWALDVFVKGTNLLDEAAHKHTSMVKDLAPLPGRGYAVGLRASF